MALPGDVTTTTITFGPYTDAAGNVALVGVTGKLFPVDPSTNKRVRVVDIASGQVVVPKDVTVTIASDGTASAGPIPRTGQAALSPTGFAWRMEWDLASSSRVASPGNLTFILPSGPTADFDLLVPAATIPAVAISIPGVPAGGTTGQVLAKASNTAYDTTWVAQTGGGGGGAVSSVNTKTGAVVLSASDVGADAAGAAATAQTAAQAYADGKVAAEVTRANAAYDTAGAANSAQTAAATDATTKASNAQAFAVQRANHTGTQAATTITGLATVATSGAYADLTGQPTIPAAATDATTSAKGIVQLAGDLAGTATAPTVPGLADRAFLRGSLPLGTWVPPKVVTACDSGVINDSGAGNGTVAHDTTVFRFGTASVKVTCVSTGATAKATFALTTQDWTNDGLTFWVRSDAWANIIDGYLLVSTSGVFGSYFICQIRPTIQRVTDGEWMQVSFTRGDFTVGAGTPTWSTVNRVMWQVIGANGTTPSLWIDQVERNRGSRRGVVAVGFDDGFATTATLAKPYMDNYGFRGSTNIILGRIGTNGYMSQAQIDSLADAGWDISAHAENDLTTLSFAAAEADVKAIKAYVDDHNYKGRNIYVYALGGQNDALRQMVRKYFATARGTSTGGQYLSRINPLNFTSRQAGQAISVATMTGWIDQAAADGRFLPLVFHNLPATTSLNEDVLPANFRSVMDYLATANVDVLTISEALARGPWGPQEPQVFNAPSGANYVLTVGNDGALTTTALV